VNVRPQPLYPHEESQDPLNRRLVDPELIWTLHIKEQSLAPASISTPSSNPVI